MRLTKSLLSIISALALATGVAFAGGGSMSHQQSYESSSPELLSDAEMWSGWSSRESSMSYQSTEAGGPELLGGYEVTSEGDVISSGESSPFPMNGSESLAGLEESDRELFAESDVMYIYPMQVTEYYLLVPSVDSETPMGG
jgi:hypothetical protein